ncbi:MAG: hypothetical protein Tsb0021_03670 [Chlamydiales bacterium]
MNIALTGSSSNNFTCVVKLAKGYIPIHIHKNGKSLISWTIEREKAIAEATARVFAQKNNVTYVSKLHQFERPVMSVIRHESRWYPSKLYTDALSKIEVNGLDGSMETAMRIAQLIANGENLDYFPYIGSSLSIK